MVNKVCPKCKEVKNVSCFGKSKQRKDGLRPWCKECHNKSNTAWRNNNKSYYKERHQENPERRKVYDARYKTKNPNYLKGYYEENKSIFIWRVNKRRGRTKDATPLWADIEKMKFIYKIAGNLNKLHGFIKYHVDHIVPLQGKTVSGLHVHNNLQIMLAEENKAKYNKWK